MNIYVVNQPRQKEYGLLAGKLRMRLEGLLARNPHNGVSKVAIVDDWHEVLPAQPDDLLIFLSAEMKEKAGSIAVMHPNINVVVLTGDVPNERVIEIKKRFLCDEVLTSLLEHCGGNRAPQQYPQLGNCRLTGV